MQVCIRGDLVPRAFGRASSSEDGFCEDQGNCGVALSLFGDISIVLSWIS